MSQIRDARLESDHGQFVITDLTAYWTYKLGEAERVYTVNIATDSHCLRRPRGCQDRRGPA